MVSPCGECVYSTVAVKCLVATRNSFSGSIIFNFLYIKRMYLNYQWNFEDSTFDIDGTDISVMDAWQATRIFDQFK